MTPEAQRIAIAEACGWRFIPCAEGFYVFEPKSTTRLVTWSGIKVEQLTKWGLPDYLSDLNAMHEAEKVLSEDMNKWYAYGETLARIMFGEEMTLERSLGERDANDNSFTPNGWGWSNIAHATAAQRAEAFLRTLNLWSRIEAASNPPTK